MALYGVHQGSQKSDGLSGLLKMLLQRFSDWLDTFPSQKPVLRHKCSTISELADFAEKSGLLWNWKDWRYYGLSFSEEQIRWCEDHLNGTVHLEMIFGMFGFGVMSEVKLTFENDADMLAFKLRWL